MRSLKTILMAWCFACIASGCGSTPVADDVDQREVNEIVAALSKHSVEARPVKARGAKGRYSVVVDDGDFTRAAQVLTRLGFPTEKKPSFEDLTTGNGFIPPSREVEALRLDRAIAAELEEVIRSRSDVSTVSVLVRMHSRDAHERATVTVIAQSVGAATFDVSEVREIAKRAVPGIQSDDVYVSVSPTRDREGVQAGQQHELVSFLGVWRVPAEDHGGLVILVVVLVAASALLAGLAGYIVGQFNWLNRQGLTAPGRSPQGGVSGGSVPGIRGTTTRTQQDQQDERNGGGEV